MLLAYSPDKRHYAYDSPKISCTETYARCYSVEDPVLQSIRRYNSEGDLNDITKVEDEMLYDHVKLWQVAQQINMNKEFTWIMLYYCITEQSDSTWKLLGHCPSKGRFGLYKLIITTNV